MLKQPLKSENQCIWRQLKIGLSATGVAPLRGGGNFVLSLRYYGGHGARRVRSAKRSMLVRRGVYSRVFKGFVKNKKLDFVM